MTDDLMLLYDPSYWTDSTAWLLKANKDSVKIVLSEVKLSISFKMQTVVNYFCAFDREKKKKVRFEVVKGTAKWRFRLGRHCSSQNASFNSTDRSKKTNRTQSLQPGSQNDQAVVHYRKIGDGHILSAGDQWQLYQCWNSCAVEIF